MGVRKGAEMKGLSLPFAIIIVTFLLTIMVIMPFLVTRIHIQREIVLETNYNKAQNILLTILSLKYSLNGETKPVYEIISEYVAFEADKPDISFLKEILDKYVPSGQYKLVCGDGENQVVLAGNGSSSKFAAVTKIVLPFNESRMTETIVLVIE